MNDSKIKIIRKMPDGEKMIVLWIGILCLGMQSGRPGILEIGDGIPFTPETLSTELDISVNTIKLGLETFSKLKMIEFFDNQTIYITNFEKHQELDRIELAREKIRLRVESHRKRKKISYNGKEHVTVTPVTCNAIELDIDQDKNKNKIDFNQFWNLYEKKIDRPKCEKKWDKLTLHEQTQILHYIPSYKNVTPDKTYRKHPATFLNNRSWENEIINNQSQTEIGSVEWEKCLQVAKAGGQGIKALDEKTKQALYSTGGLSKLRFNGNSFELNQMKNKFINCLKE